LEARPIYKTVLNFRRWFEDADEGLEDQIIAAIPDESVGQAQFDSLLHRWVKETNPELSGVKLQRGYGTPYNTSFLSGQYSPTLAAIAGDRKEKYGFSGIGLIVQPLTYQYLRSETLGNFDGIGIDNGMFTEAGRKAFTWPKYEKMVKTALAQEKREVLSRVHFFTVPDEPMNWDTTLDKFRMYQPDVQKLRKYGAPVAVCIQNGASVATVPWGSVDVIFIGGDDKWKTGDEAKAIVKEAQRRHVTVHMGRVNNLKRMNTASEWQVETADGTYVMHELAKSLHDIERRNPQRRDESQFNYYRRLKRILHGEHDPKDVEKEFRPVTEPEIVHNFVNYVLDNQKNNWLQRRYDAIAGLARQMGRTLHRSTLMELDRYLPQVPGLETDEDVVEFDPAGNIRVDARGMPLKNREAFSELWKRLPYRPMPEGIPSDPKDWRVYNRYINRYIARMRDKGVMPR